MWSIGAKFDILSAGARRRACAREWVRISLQCSILSKENKGESDNAMNYLYFLGVQGVEQLLQNVPFVRCGFAPVEQSWSGFFSRKEVLSV